MKKPLIIMFMILICSTLVAAAPPFVQESERTNELTIVVPKVDYFELNKNIDFYVHVFNSTGHLQNNVSTTCELHIFNHTGHNIYDEAMIWSTSHQEFEAHLNTTYTEDIALYGFIVQCNQSGTAGFFSATYQVGTASTDYGSSSIIGLAILVIGIMFFFVYLSRNIEGKEWFHTGIKMFFVVTSFWVLVIGSSLSIAYARVNALGSNIINTMNSFQFVSVYAAWIFTILLMIYFLYGLFNAWKFKREQQKQEMYGEHDV